MSKHAQIGPQGAEKQQIKIYMEVGDIKSKAETTLLRAERS